MKSSNIHLFFFFSSICWRTKKNWSWQICRQLIYFSWSARRKKKPFLFRGWFVLHILFSQLFFSPALHFQTLYDDFFLDREGIFFISLASPLLPPPPSPPFCIKLQRCKSRQKKRRESLCIFSPRLKHSNKGGAGFNKNIPPPHPSLKSGMIWHKIALKLSSF